MIEVAKEWNPKQALLKDIILNPEKFSEAIDLCLEMHAMVHVSEVSGSDIKTFEDNLWDGFDDELARIMPTAKDDTIVWNILHLSRIEDLTTNILINDGIQVFNSSNWREKMNIDISDTGNVMTVNEIIELSKKVNLRELRNYRICVGRNTREVLKNLTIGDMKRKVKAASLQRIFDEGGVVEASKGLLDFWGRKNIAGILLMPVTRHQIVHLNDSFRIKEKLGRYK